MNGKARVGQQGRAVILVVEDEVLIRIAVAERLREAGYIVVEAATAEDAMRLLNAGQVSLVFADMNLPGDMDGNALAAWIEATRPEVRVLMTSTHQAANGRPFIAKPHDPAALVKAIEALLS